MDVIRDVYGWPTGFHPANDSRADCLNLLGLIYVRTGDIKQAANYAQQCLKMDMKSGDDDRISSSMNTVAGIYMAGYQAKEAERYILGAIAHSAKVNNPARRAVILGMASEIYHVLRDNKKALSYAEQAYSIDSLLGRELQSTIRLSQKGSALLGLHRYQEAEAIYRKVIPVLKASGDYHSYALALSRLGMALLRQERQREAIPYYKEAAELFSKMGDLVNEIHTHRALCNCYWKIDPDSAKIELDCFDILKDSLYTHSSAEALSRYNADFGNDLLQQENAKMRQANQRTMIIAIVVVVLVLLVVWFAVMRLHRRQQQKTRELVAEIEKLRSVADKKPQSVTEEKEQPMQTKDEIGENDEDKLFLMHVIETVNAAMPDGCVGVEQIASDMNMSVQTFRRRLQVAAGETPKAYILAIQMERAVRLLTDRLDMLLSTIAEQCGFEDTSSFGHAFKRIYGCSPSQYREQHRQTSER